EKGPVEGLIEDSPCRWVRPQNHCGMNRFDGCCIDRFNRHRLPGTSILHGTKRHTPPFAVPLKYNQSASFGSHARPGPEIRNTTACSQGLLSGRSIINAESSRFHCSLPAWPSSSTFSIFPGTCGLFPESCGITACFSGQPITNA